MEGIHVNLDCGVQIAPYDVLDDENKEPYISPGSPIDEVSWEVAAARGVIDHLCDRKGFKSLFSDIDDYQLRKDIVDAMAEVIREAHRLGKKD